MSWRDYVLGNRMFGGNAQLIIKYRWIRRASFLWDFQVRNMGYLKLPIRAPEYRSERNHLEFICGLKDYMPRPVFIDETVKAAGTHFSVRRGTWSGKQSKIPQVGSLYTPPSYSQSNVKCIPIRRFHGLTIVAMIPFFLFSFCLIVLDRIVGT